MTKVKKTKKPKAKKVGKKSVSKTLIGSAVPKGTHTTPSTRVEKIDRRLRPTPPPKLVKVDPMLYNPLKISDNQRSRLISDVPMRMFSGQETANLNRQFDILTSKEKQVEQKIAQLEKNSLRNEINANLTDLNGKIDKLIDDENITKKKYLELKKRLLEINRIIPKDDNLLFNMYENLSDKLEDINYYLAGDDFSEVKSTNTLLDDKINNNNLLDEANIFKENLKSRKPYDDDFSVDSLDN